MKLGRQGAVLATLLWQFCYSLSFAAWPVKNVMGEEIGTITDIYSSRRLAPPTEIGINYEFHKGVDIAASAGTPVHAISPGRVKWLLNPDRPVYNHIAVTDAEGVRYDYGHVIPVVADGATVVAGQCIATIAVHSELDHLHFSIRNQSDKPIKNPLGPGGPITDKDADPLWKPVVKDIYFRSDDFSQLGGAVYGADGSLTAYGAVDLVAPAMDSSGGIVNKNSPLIRQDAGIMQLMWKIGETGSIRYLLKDGQWDNELRRGGADILFNEADIPCDTGICTATTDDDKQGYYYILTNTADTINGTSLALAQEGAWNTKLKKGAAWYKGSSAEINDVDSPSGPEYPDGLYSVYARAGSDEAADLGDWAERTVYIDNFRPYVKQVEVRQGTNIVYKRSWELEWDQKLQRSILRSYAPSVEKTIIPGEYTVVVTFSERMKSASLVGVNNIFEPNNTVQTSPLSIGAYSMDAMLPLEIIGADVAGKSNELLALLPGRSYIDPAKELTRDAVGGMQGMGGSDKFHSIRIESGRPPMVAYEDRNNILGNGCGGTCSTEIDPINLPYNLVRFRYSDIGSGIKTVNIHKKDSAIPDKIFSYAPHVYTQEITLNLEDGLYMQTVTDNNGNSTVMWFRVDPESPMLKISGINMDLAAETFTIHGTVQDTNAGMDFLRLDGGGLHHDFATPFKSKELINFTSPVLNVAAGSYYVFSAQDKAGNGSFPQPIFEFIKMSDGVGPGQTNVVANYISEVKASGEPCTITITSERNIFAIPIDDGVPDGGSISAALPSASLTPQVVATPNMYLHGNVSVGVTQKCNVVNGNNVCYDACNVSLAGSNILPLANGPAEAFVRNSSVTTSGTRFRFEWSEITFFNLAPDPDSELTMERVPSQKAPDKYVVEPPGSNHSLRLKYARAKYDGIKIKTCGMLPGSTADMKIIHYKDDGTQEILAGVNPTDEEYDLDIADADHCVTGLSGSNSLFSLVAPISKYDNAGPVVVFKLSGDTFEKDGAVYISSSSPVALDAEDRSSNTFALAGVASTYYQLDAEPIPVVYNGPLLLNEGARSIYYYAVDKIDNIGEGKVAQLRVDSTPPASALKLNGLPIASGATVYANTADFITLVTTDAVSNGVSSGLTTTYFLVDVSPEDCESYWSSGSGGINGMGSCDNSFYAAPFNLPPGKHTIYYQSVDNVRNMEAGKSAFIEVLPPVVLTSVTLNTSFVFLQIGSTQQFSATGMFSDGTSRALTASDGPLWSVAHGTVAAISPTGLVTGTAYGKTQVRVSFGSLSADAYLFVYEPLPPSFTATGSMTVPRHTHTATLLPDGTVLVAGGNNGAQILSSAEIYYPKTGEFKITGFMNATRGRGHTETLLPDGTVLLTGGISGNSIVATAEVYNPATGAFLTKSRMAIERYSHSATLLPNGKVLITGGASETGTVSQAELYDPSNGTFTPAGSLGMARYYHTATLLPNGKVLVAGGLAGLGSGYTDTAEIYDPVNKTFLPTGSLNMARAFAKAVLLWTGEVLLVGGSNSNSSNVLAAETYNPVSGSFSVAGSLSVGRKVGHTATLLPDGRVLVAGGDVYGNNPVSLAEIYDPVTRKFGATVPMNSGRFFHAAALLLPNGRVLVCGGNNAVSSLNTAELYNLGFGVPSTLESITVIPSSATIEVGGTKQFTATGNFSDGSSRPLGAGLTWSVVPSTVAAIDQVGLAAGIGLGKARITVSSGSVSAEAVLVVSPPEPKFIATGSMTVPRHTHTATLLPNGNVLVAGGNNGAQILSSAEIYYPATGKFIATGFMSATRGRGHTETLLPDGTVLLTGGISGNSIVVTAEVYNPATETFSPAGSMAAARYSHNATLLADGKVLITGGAGDNGTVSQAELYDPVYRTFSPAGSLGMARYYHTATLLPNGKVLVAGGLTGLGSGYTATAEVYDPVNKTFSPTGLLNMARAFAKAVLLRNGEVLLAGGSSSNSSNVLAAETYNPVSRSFSVAGSLSVGRKVGHTATLLPDGRALVAGGDVYGNNNPISLAEIYDPVFRTFSVTAPMSSGRFFHAAALLLPNGKVLVCGGNNATSSLTTAELFDSGFRGTLSPMLTSLLVSPSTASITVGGARQFTASGNFSNGSSRVLNAADGLAWSVGHGTVAAITADGGLASGIGYGKTMVTASSGIFTAEAALSVFYPPGVSNDGLVSLSVPDTGVSITAVSTVTITSTATIFSAMSGAGLKPAMDAFYDFQPSGVQFAAPVKLRFVFDPALVEAAAVAIYYFDGVTWSSASIANQATGLLADGRAYVEGYISHTSIYAALYFKDIVAPVTGLAFSAPNFGTEPVYISSSTQLSLAAYDDAVTAGDRLGGLAASYYAVDSEVFTLYAGTFSIAGEGSYIVGYYSVDTAGNRENSRSASVSVDFTPAVSSVSLGGTAGRNGWFVSPIAVTLVSTDSLSGVADAYYSLADAPFALYRSSFGISGEGLYALRHYAVDNLGNTEAEKSLKFAIDTSTPVITLARTPGHNAAGWHNSPVSVVFSGTDAVSGISYCSPAAVLETEGFGQPVSGYCMDYAGWSSTATLTLNIDKTAPAIMISSPTAGNLFVATKDRIGLFFNVADNLDPAPKASALLTQLEDKGSPRGGRPAVIAVTYGQSIEPLDIDDGIWRLTVSATDFADNTNTLFGGTFEVVHDVLAPRTTRAIAGGVSLAAGVTTYITGDTVLKLSSMDDLVSSEDGIGLGVKKQAIKLKAEGTIVREISFENPEPKQGVVFTSTFSASGCGLADGLYSLGYRAEDILGNIETEKTFAIGLDNTAPETTAELTGTPGENGWHISAVTVRLAAIDALSGVEGIYYQLESSGQKSELRSYTAPFTASAEGLYKVYFYAKDKLGNTEAEKSIAFKIDFTNPLISAERTPPANTYGWNNTAVTVSYLCTDGLSGVKSCPPVAVISNEGFAQSASGEGQDNAGNRSSASVSGINIDKTVPVSAYRVEGMIYNAGDGKTYLSPMSKLSLSAADPVSGGTASGIEVIEYDIDSGAFEVYTSSFGLSAGIRSVYYRSRDKAGNEEPASSAVFHVDGANPLTSFNISGQPYIVDGTHYVTSQSVLSFAAVDPLTDGVASGVLITKYRLDGGAWQVYTASITIPAEGLHKLDYYSIDNVQNAEALRTLTIIVDNTAPLTAISVGEPKFEVFGLKIITPETPVTLAASDPDAAGPASGVKSIYYELTDAAGWSSGTLNYTEPFTTGRQGTYTVRYWSADNAGNTGTPQEAKLRVSSLRSDALDAVDGLEMTGSADIAGTVRSNTTVSLAGNARILGDVYASTISLSGKALVTGQQHSGAATLIPVPLELADIVDIASNTNNNSLIPAKYLVDGKLVVPAKDAITLSTGIYYFNGIELGGGAKVSVNGKVDMLVAGDISINGGASLNAAGGSSLLNIFLSTESALTFTGGGSLAAYVYAPYSQLKLAGNALLGGHYLVKQAIISGAGNIVQAGETLPQAASATGDTGGKKKASALAISGSYNVLAGPDPAFRLGEVYAFPNPAKGGEAPVFHIETGIADSVNIKIYTVSGRAAHEYTLTGMPAELDDGNGLSYAYEYTWRGHIPSGVYLYYIETQKAGQKLKKTGKFSVIR